MVADFDLVVTLPTAICPCPIASLVAIRFSRSSCGQASASDIVIRSANSCELSYAYHDTLSALFPDPYHDSADYGCDLPLN